MMADKVALPFSRIRGVVGLSCLLQPFLLHECGLRNHLAEDFLDYQGLGTD